MILHKCPLYFFIRIWFLMIKCAQAKIDKLCSIFNRETLLGQLQEFIKSMKDDFMARSGQLSQSKQKPPRGKNLPEVVNDIVWARQLQTKV